MAADLFLVLGPDLGLEPEEERNRSMRDCNANHASYSGLELLGAAAVDVLVSVLGAGTRWQLCFSGVR